MNNFVSLEPKQFPAYLEAIESAGAKVVPLGPEVRAMVWTDYANPQGLRDVLQANPQLQWVQLPFAGVDAFNDIIQLNPVFTSAKRSYSEPVAEHALMLCMALGRILPERIRATSWGKKQADSLFDAEVLIIGGGGIAEQLVEQRYLRNPPMDPIAERKDAWVMVAPPDGVAGGVADIKSGATGRARDGSLFAEW